MAAEEDSCWLNREGEMPSTHGSLLEITNLHSNKSMISKIKEDDVLPCHQNIVTEYLTLKEKLRQTTDKLTEKEREIELKKQETKLRSEELDKENHEIAKRLELQEKTMVQIDEQICTEKAEIEKLNKENEVSLQNLTDTQKRIKEIQDEMDMASKQTPSSQASDTNGYGLLLRNLDHLSEMIINYAEQNTISVSIIGGKDDNGQPIQEVEVLLLFNANNFQTLLGAEVKSDICSWQDLIDTAVQNDGDAVWLLGEIKKRVNSLHGLKDEIDFLQQKYAIDWQPDQRLITVIIPGKRQSTCKLQLHGNYPAVASIECVHADEQLTEKIAVIDLQMKRNEISTLADWLEELHKDP